MATQEREPNIGVSLSGGGHRATLFGLGTLIYLTHARVNHWTRTISSVSGGSLTNAFVAQQGDFAGQSRDDFHVVAHELGRQIAQRGTLWAVAGTWIYIALLVVTGLATFGVWFLPFSWLPRLVFFIVAIAAWFMFVFSKRGVVCGRAYKKTLFSANGRTSKLEDLHDVIDHVICVTELHSGEHFYFSSRFVYGYRVGWGEPGGLPVHAAVQASTAVPGAFPARWFRASRFRFEGGEHGPRFLVVVDGGVYDNMADQWPAGLKNRIGQWGDRAPNLRAIDELVVVNCSAGMEWSSVGSLGLPVLGELTSVLRSSGVMYDNSASLRKRGLVARFDLSELGPGDGGVSGLTGALVDIAQNPFRVPKAFENDHQWPGRRDRARTALAALEALGISDEQWCQIVAANSSVATTLRSLGTEVSARLLQHAFVLSAVNLHVILGYPLVELPQREFFIDLVT